MADDAQTEGKLQGLAAFSRLDTVVDYLHEQFNLTMIRSGEIIVRHKILLLYSDSRASSPLIT